MDSGYLGDVGKQTKPLGSTAVGPLQCAGYVICDWLERPAVAIVAMNRQSLWTSELGWWGSTTRSWTMCTFTINLQWWQLHCSTRDAAYGDLLSTHMSFLRLAEKERPMDKCLQFELQLWKSISNFDTDTDTYTDTYLTTRVSATEQPATNNTSTLFVEWKSISPWRSISKFDTNTDTSSHTHAHTRLLEHPPLYNRLWAGVCKREMSIFYFICRAEVNIVTAKSLQFQHRQHNVWLAPRGCAREWMMLQLLGTIPSIQYTASTAGLYICSTRIPITIQQDCVSPSEMRLTASQPS